MKIDRLFDARGNERKLVNGMTIPKGSIVQNGAEITTLAEAVVVKKTPMVWNSLTQSHDGGEFFIELGAKIPVPSLADELSAAGFSGSNGCYTHTVSGISAYFSRGEYSVGRAKFATLKDLVAAIPSLVADRDEEAVIAARHAERLAANKAAELAAKLAQDELNASINAKIKTGEYTHNFTHMYGTGKVFSGDVLIAKSSAIRATQQWSSKDAWGTGHDEPSPIIGYHYTLCDPQQHQ
jgi:hypothetical protein